EFACSTRDDLNQTNISSDQHVRSCSHERSRKGIQTMTTIKRMKLSALAVLAATGTAQAHATFTSATVAAEGYALMQLQVPHGCEGKATNQVRIELPEGFVFAKPQPKPGW